MQIDLDTQGFAELSDDFEDLKDKGDADAVFSVGTNKEYGIILEMGRGPIEADEGSALKFDIDGETVYRKRVEGHPPYPWFRPAIVEFQANPEDFVLDNTDYNSIEEIPNANALVQAVSAALTAQMENNVSANTTGDRSPGTHPEHPQRDTGNLVASISFVQV